MADDFSADVRQYIDQHIESLAQLEALLLLRREPERTWEAAEAAKSLYIPPEQAGTLLADLSRRGFAAAIDANATKYRYQAAADVDRVIGELAQAYQDRRVAVISQIYSKPLNKVQTFAEAFRLRKEDSP
jgi:integrase